MPALRRCHAPLSHLLLLPRAAAAAHARALTVLGLLAVGARAELLGTHPHHNGSVQLMTDLCRAGDATLGQRAWQTVGGRERQGCWGVDRAGNPVVTWSDNSELVLDGNKVRLSRRMAGLLERAEAVEASLLHDNARRA